MASRKRTPTLDPSVERVLAGAEEAHRTRVLAEAREFALAAEWASLHPGDDVVEVLDTEGDLVMYGDQPLSLAGEGTPTVAEFCIAEFAAAVGVSTQAGRRFVGAAVETKHRLPLLWESVMSCRVPVWKVRRISERTHRLPPEGAAYVDRELARIAHACSFAEIERVTAAAVAEFDNERVEELRQERWQLPHVDIALGDVALNKGLVPISGLLEIDDALSLERAIRDRAHQLLAEHPELDLDRRRAVSLGQLADRALGSGGRELVIYTHHSPERSHGILDVEGTDSVVTVEQLAEWCARADTRVSIRPVLELDEELRTDRYEPTAKQREQAVLTCPTCVFPGCGRSARRCDLDHIVAWGVGGKTESWNLAPLCRLHHRMKTHGRWRYRRLTRTSFVWTSPLGRTYGSDVARRRRTC